MTHFRLTADKRFYLRFSLYQHQMPLWISVGVPSRLAHFRIFGGTQNVSIFGRRLYPFYSVRDNFLQKFKCIAHGRCVAYTFKKLHPPSCTLHARIEKGKIRIQGKQTGVKKTDYVLSLLEISFCYNKNRRRRCRKEPKCHHVNCFRNAQNFLRG